MRSGQSTSCTPCGCLPSAHQYTPLQHPSLADDIHHRRCLDMRDACCEPRHLQEAGKIQQTWKNPCGVPPNIALAQPAAQIGSRVPSSEHSPPAVRCCARTHMLHRWHNTAVLAPERPVYRQVDKNNVPPQTVDQCAAAARTNLWHSYGRGGGGPGREQRACHSKRRLAGSLTPIYAADRPRDTPERRRRGGNVTRKLWREGPSQLGSPGSEYELCHALTQNLGTAAGAQTSAG